MLFKCLLLLCIVNYTFAFYVGEYVPKSFYKIHNGEKSPTFYIDTNALDPLIRQRRKVSDYDFGGIVEEKENLKPITGDVLVKLRYGDDAEDRF